MRNKILLGVIILSLAVKITMLFVIPSSGPETWEYEVIANNILEGRGYQMEHLGAAYYSPFPPLYTFLCAGIYFLTNHSHLAVQLFQIILSCLIALTVYAIGKKVFGEKTGLVAAFLTAFHPGLTVYSIWKIHPLVLDSFLIMLVVLTFLDARAGLSSWKAFLSGAVTGLAMLTRPTVGLFMVFGTICLALSKGINKKRLLVFVCILFSSSALVIAPWIIRNYSIHKRVVFTSGTGELFWRGNNVMASGSSYLASGKTVTETMSKELAGRIYGKSELEQKDVFMKEAYGFIRENPASAAWLFARKFYYYWWFSPQSGILYPKHWLKFYMLYYGAVIFLSAAGLYRIIHIRGSQALNSACFLFLMMLSISLAQSLFYVEARHRWAIEPLLLIFSANGIISIQENKCVK